MAVDRFNEWCEALLARYNRRDTHAITRHLESLCSFLREGGNHVVQTMYGGSVRRGTYVAGLSDVDVLLIVNQSSLVNQPPSTVIEYVRETIQGRLPQNPVTSGNLAVTVGYSDATEIQVLPAIRRKGGGVRIADPGSATWSNIIQPENFTRKLIEVNQARNGRVVPTIKLAKAIADCFITQPSRNITGFLMESLAIEAFRDYQLPQDPKTMLNHLFRNSVRAVMNPIANATGQSRFVDEYLGPAGSRSRQRVSTYFVQIRGKVNSCRTREDVDRLFCDGRAV